MHDGNWILKAACRNADVEIFYSGREEDTRAAIALCRSCEVRATCFEVALADGEHFGVWGGVPETQRRRVLRRQRREEAARSSAA